MPDQLKPSLLGRLLLRIAPVTVALLVAGAALSYAIARYYSDQVYDRWLYDSARTLAAQIRFQSQPSLELPEIALEMFTWDEKDKIFFEVEGDQRRKIAGNAYFAHLPVAVTDSRGHYYDTTIAGDPVRAVVIAVPSPAPSEFIRVTVAETLHKRTALAQEILIGMIPLQLVLLVTGTLAVWLALRDGLKVVSETAAQIRCRDPGDMAPVVMTGGTPAEMAPLVAAINDLLSRVEKAQQAQQRFLANAAHQLRTPVATLQVQIERALREREPDRRALALAHVGEAIKRLGHLLHQLLTLAQVEPDSQSGVALIRCDLVALAKDCIERHVDEAVAADCDLGYMGPDGRVEVFAAATLVHEMLANLIDNALQYGRPGGRVTVTVADGPPRLWVEDDGPGIAPSESERVWDRFYRVSGSPGFGCGLGLAIVREIAERHAAIVTLESGSGNRGTRVTIFFSPANAVDPILPVITGTTSASAGPRDQIYASGPQ